MNNHHLPNRTSAENVLAKALRNKKIRFLQNFYLEGYELDFFLPEFKIAIEVDGFFHLSTKRQFIDLQKEEYLTAHGITLFRFSNQQIYQELAMCLKILDELIKSLRPNITASINTHWKEALRDFTPPKPRAQRKKFSTIEDYFLSLDE